jgi:hypothetical protein
MTKHHSEIFGQFRYDDSLTYEQLLGMEVSLITDLNNLMLRAGAEHLNFTPMGDELWLQCSFAAHKLYVYRKIALETAAMLPPGITGRLLCLHKSLDALHVYWIQAGQWEEEERPVPQKAPDGLKIRRLGSVKAQRTVD